MKFTDFLDEAITEEEFKRLDRVTSKNRKSRGFVVDTKRAPLVGVQWSVNPLGVKTKMVEYLKPNQLVKLEK